MDSAGWERIQNVFHEAADRPEGERAAFVAAASGGDGEVMRAVFAMLEEDARAASLLDGDVSQVADRMLAPLPVRQVGRYRLLRVIGEGGMGVVYLAERPDLGSKVAIKILRDAWMSPARRQRFAAEQRTLAQLTHSSIAHLYDADTLPDGTPWFAMEYVDGVPLTQFCAERASSVEERLRLLRAVCEAVQYAHSRAVIHRDLKPSNILVQSEGEVKLVDFGIAKHLADTDAPIDQTQTALRLLTPAYAAPEQVRGEPVGIYTDVYSLGVILYELLTGKLPIPGEPVRPNSGPDLDVLCARAMHPVPERRYRSVEALLRDIDHYLAGEPLDARPDTLRYRAGKFVRRNREKVAAAALVVMAITSLVLFYTARLRAARNAAVAEAARTQRILRFTLNLFNGGDREAGPASDLRVRTLIDRGVAEAGNLERDPAIQAQLYQTLGEVYDKLGEFNRADELLKSAMGRRTDAAGIIETQTKIAVLRVDEAKLQEAEKLAREALGRSKRELPPGHPMIAQATQTLGKVLEESGSYAEAIGVLTEAVRLRSAPPVVQSDLAESLLELANSHFYAGHYDEAERLNQRLLTMHRELFGARHPLVAEDLINLGAIQQERGQYVKAEEYHRQALAITETFYGPDHYKTASNLTLIARALNKQNRGDEAAGLLQRALTIQEKVFGPVHPRVASTVNEIATLALTREKYDEAEAGFRRMAEIYRKVYAGKHYLIGIAVANLGSVYLARKDWAQAEPLFREALAMYAQTLPPGHINFGITQIKLGRALLRQRRYREAEKETQAGYDILAKQANPSVTWLQQARKDLAEEAAAR